MGFVERRHFGLSGNLAAIALLLLTLSAITLYAGFAAPSYLALPSAILLFLFAILYWRSSYPHRAKKPKQEVVKEPRLRIADLRNLNQSKHIAPALTNAPLRLSLSAFVVMVTLVLLVVFI